MSDKWLKDPKDFLLNMLMTSNDDPNNDVVEDDLESSGEEDNVEVMEEEDNTSQSEESSAESDNDGKITNYFTGKDKITKWRKSVPLKIKSEHTITEESGVMQNAKGVKSEYEAWSCFFTEEIMNIILTHTNKHINIVKTKYTRDRDARETSMCEMKAFIGLLYLAAVLKGNRQSLEDLWSTDGMGVELFRLTMSINRFKFLLRCVRFDDKTSREARKKTDKLAPVREMFSHFVENCKNSYNPGQYVTVDEKSESFKGRCSFKQYIPHKPGRYGIKIFAMVDSKSLYTSNLEIYAGKQPDGPFYHSNAPADVVKRLAINIYSTGRNITADSWFTDFQLIQDLQKEGLTYVGTVRKGKLEIPAAFVSIKYREENSSLFGFNEGVTLVSYVPKKDKNILLMSSLHHDDKIDEFTGDAKMPESVKFYNDTKSSVNLVEEMCAAYNTARNTSRWSMVIFYTMLNIAGINSQVVYMDNQNSVVSRKVFLKNLVMGLTSEHIQKRAGNPRGIPRSLQTALEMFKPAEVPETEPASTSGTRKRKFCEPCKAVPRRRSTQYMCQKCKKVYLCLQHAIMVCGGCFKCIKMDNQEASSSD